MPIKIALSRTSRRDTPSGNGKRREQTWPRPPKLGALTSVSRQPPTNRERCPSTMARRRTTPRSSATKAKAPSRSIFKTTAPCPLRSCSSQSNWVHDPTTSIHARGLRRLHAAIADDYSRTTLRIRSGTGEDSSAGLRRVPHAIMHRPIPAGATISWAVVQLNRYGPRHEWMVAFTVSLPDDKSVSGASRGRGAVAINLGWRLIPNTRELRVCILLRRRWRKWASFAYPP